MQQRLRLFRGVFLTALLVILTLSVSLNLAVFPAAADEPTGIVCAISPDEVAGQGGLTVGSLGLTVGSLGLTVGSLGLTPGSLALTPGSLALTPGSLGLTPGSLGDNTDAQLQALLAEIANNPANATWLARFMPVLQTGAGFGAVPVAVLIVDDFEDTPNPAEVVHGEAVLEVFNQVIAAANLPGVRAFPVDVSVNGNYEVDGIADRIRNTVTQLRTVGANGVQYERFVVNMSFGLIPCDDEVQVNGQTIVWNYEQFLAQRDQEFQDEPIQLILECVVRNRDNTHTAHFGYINPNDYPVIVPYSNQNKLTGGGLNSHQQRARTPIYFGVPSDNPYRPSGTQFYPHSGFQINFNNGTLVWHFQGQQFRVNPRQTPNCNTIVGGGNVPADAMNIVMDGEGNAPMTGGHPRPSYNPVRPILECVQPLANGRFLAHFGYQNENNFLVTILHGNNNKLTGGGLNSSQLSNRTFTLFGLPQVVANRPGRSQFYPNPAFSIEFDGSNLVWTLKGPNGQTRTATANGSTMSQRCPELPRSNDYSLADYFGVSWPTIIPQLINNPVVEDPDFNDLIPLFQEYLNESADDTNFALIPFGASGNSRPIFQVNGFAAPFSPARLPQVIAVGSTLGQSEPNAPFAAYSHDASILTPGAWYRFFNVDYYGAGTSYSTPAASAFASVFMAFADPDACDFTTDTEGVGRTPLRQAGFINARFNSQAAFWPLDCDLPVADINEPPVAFGTSGEPNITDEDMPTHIYLSAYDPDEDPLTFIIVDMPEFGTLDVSELALGKVIYTPNSDFNGEDSFTFKANDGQADSNIATIEIYVAPVNDAPTADSGSVITNEDTPVGIVLTGGDIDSESVSFIIVTPPVYGVLSGEAPNLTYAPGANFFGADSFTFITNDGELVSATATISITVNPVNDAPSLTAPTNQSNVRGTAITPLQVNAGDVEDAPSALFFSSTTLPTGLSISPSGLITGTPTVANTFAVSVTVMDAGGLTDTKSFNWTITEPAFDPAVCRAAGAVSVVNNRFGVANRVVSGVYQPVATNRTVLNNALGVPQYDDRSNVGINFVSLGFDNPQTENYDAGAIVLDFGANTVILPNPGGWDFTVAETSWGNPSFNSYPEQAEVFVAQYLPESADDWVSVGVAQLDKSFELPEGMEWAQYVMIMDISVRTRFSVSSTSDGFDVDGVGACVVGENPYYGETADAPAAPVQPVVANQPPTVEAGADVLVTDYNNDGFEPVALNALANDVDGTIVGLAWSTNTGLWIDPLATTLANIPVGTHLVTVLVIDDGGLSAVDTLTIVVNQPPYASAGLDMQVMDADNSGSEAVMLVATGVDADGMIASYTWSSDTGLLVGPLADAAVTVELPVGVHVFTLTVIDNYGAATTALVTVTVSAPPAQ